MRKKLIIIGVVISFLTLVAVLILCNRNYVDSFGLASEVYLNWEVKISPKAKTIYKADTNEGFTGDGYRYSVLQYSSLKNMEDNIEWSSDFPEIEERVEGKTVEELCHTWLSCLNIDNQYEPKFINVKCFYLHRPGDYLILIKDETTMTMYVLQNYS